MVIESLDIYKTYVSIQLDLTCTNNQANYKAIIIGVGNSIR